MALAAPFGYHVLGYLAKYRKLMANSKIFNGG